MLRRSKLVLTGLLLAAGCAAAPTPRTGPADLTAPSACVGTLAAAPPGTQPVDDPALLAAALGAPGQGQLCQGAVFEATQPVQLYRAWSADKPWSEIGRWWSLAPPAGSVDTYRAENAICPEWSALDRLSVCTLKPGARFVMGTGQSAACANLTYPASPTQQLFIDNDTRAERVFVEACQLIEGWPP